MGLFNNLFGEDKSTRLFQLQDFEGQYLLNVNNEFIMGKENPAISLQTESQLSLTQNITETGISNTLTTNSITGKTDNETMQPHLKQALLLGGISKTIACARNEKGKITAITNKEQLQQDWLLWKETTLPTLYPDAAEQAIFAANYEKGLELMEESLPNNLHYFLLLPDIYHIKNHVTQNSSNATSERIIPSKLIDGMQIRYRFVTTAVEYDERSVIHLSAEIRNEGEMQQQYLKKLYKAQSEFSLSDYAFTIEIDYLVESHSGKTLSGNLFLKEKMHDHLQYILHIQLAEGVHASADAPPPQARKPRRSFLADEIANEEE
jgi:hypothetical protein